MSKEQIYEGVTAKRPQPSFAYEADAYTKMYIRQQSVTDTGRIIFSPPDIYQFEMRKAGTKVTSVGDTSWTTLPNGSVTRTIDRKGVGVPGGGSQSFGGAPDMRRLLSDFDFTVVKGEAYKRSVVRRKDARDVTIKFDMQMPHGTQKAHATFDTTSWLLRRLVVFGGPAGTTETGYSYVDFHGYTMLSQVHVVMGANGFMKMSYSNYRKRKKLSREELGGF